jgi:hypothetical protein
MGLFKRRPSSSTSASSTSTTQVPGLADLAASRGWQSVAGAPLGSRFTDAIHRAAWMLYDRQYTAVYDPTSVEHRTLFEDAYRGQLDDRGVAVANAWTNIGPQDLVKLHQMMGLAVCAVELASLSPIVLLQPRGLSPVATHLPSTSTGNADFDDRYVLTLSPLVDAAVMTPEIQQRIGAHDDWAFLGEDNWIACASRGPFESADDVSRRLDEVLGIVTAFPASIVPTHVDHSADDLAARIKSIATIEEAIAFLQALSADDRERLARSDTPLARFSDVTTPEQAIARFETLDMNERAQLLAMFERVDEA